MTPTAKNRAEFIEECKSGKLDGVVAAYRTFGSISITGLVDEELVKALPESLKFIAHNGESIAFSALSALVICLALAEHAAFELLGLAGSPIFFFHCAFFEAAGLSQRRAKASVALNLHADSLPWPKC